MFFLLRPLNLIKVYMRNRSLKFIQLHNKYTLINILKDESTIEIPNNDNFKFLNNLKGRNITLNNIIKSVMHIASE